MSSSIDNTKHSLVKLNQSIITPQDFYKLVLLDKCHEKNIK